MGVKEILDDVMERNEKQLTQFAAELLQNERFTESVVRAIELSTTARNQMDTQMQGLLRAMNLPDREHFDNVIEKVKTLSKTLSDLDSRITKLSARLKEESTAMAGAEEAQARVAELEAENAKLQAKFEKRDKDLKKVKKDLKKVEDELAAASSAGE